MLHCKTVLRQTKSLKCPETTKNACHKTFIKKHINTLNMHNANRNNTIFKLHMQCSLWKTLYKWNLLSMNYIKTTVSVQQLRSCFYDHRKVSYSSICLYLLEFLKLRCVSKLFAWLRINISLIRKITLLLKKKRKGNWRKLWMKKIKKKMSKRRKKRKRGENLFFIMNFQGYVTF